MYHLASGTLGDCLRVRIKSFSTESRGSEPTRPTTGEIIDVTPHPCPLAVLGDIEFAL